jgi:hypothetical protein
MTYNADHVIGMKPGDRRPQQRYLKERINEQENSS